MRVRRQRRRAWGARATIIASIAAVAGAGSVVSCEILFPIHEEGSTSSSGASSSGGDRTCPNCLHGVCCVVDNGASTCSFAASADTSCVADAGGRAFDCADPSGCSGVDMKCCLLPTDHRASCQTANASCEPNGYRLCKQKADCGNAECAAGPNAPSGFMYCQYDAGG